ncbi:hypothetical protein EHH44_19520 [Mycolicibacter terrae]|uniref:GP55 protein n=2 Tax=Mycolicibacter TaxID=1073531 RepID=A0A1A2P2S0_MYCSD|nr:MULTISPECIES: hypothetical protein [Mycolicibacter]OBH21606.1 hypothetical protein A5694_12765 [Mycolicibacter sinensis]OBI29812.1 hypothetical protein A5710_20660 [Mycolicibacter sinensis]RRR40988.1 hypothetical protein EHH44_19520 [Mycolicibacter terrae]
MTSVLIVATLALIAYSSWIRRDTWWSRWEAAASLALVLEAGALLLMSPWGATAIGPILRRGLGVWNVQQMLGHLCLIAAVVANIYHMLVRLADPAQVRSIMRRHLTVPVWLGVALMVPSYLLADQEYRLDLFAAAHTDSWLIAYEVVGCAVLLYLSAYVSRLMLTLREDPRAKSTIDLYLVSMTFASAGCLIVIGSAWVEGGAASPAIWTCICLSVGTFAYGSARSWQAKSAWFTSGGGTAIGAQ